MKFPITAFALIACLAGFASLAVADHHEGGGIKEAVAVISPTKASGSDVQGVVMLKQMKGYVHVTGKVTGLTPGEHGFHIHQYGDLRAADGTSAGGHYNPTGHKHGGPKDKERHIGDMGNITANDEGVAMIDAKADKADLHMLVGRSIVVHGGVDDLTSQPAGDAGPRVGIGVIGLAEQKAATASK